MDQALNNSHELIVYYDGLCKVCAKEIEYYRKQDTNALIVFTDISSPTFVAKSEGLDPEEVQKVFHVRDSDGTLFKGVDGFIQIWKTLDIFRPLSTLSNSRYFRPLLELGYLGFCKVRPLLPRYSCTDDHCRI